MQRYNQFILISKFKIKNIFKNQKYFHIVNIHQRILLIIKEKGFSEQKDFCSAIGVKYPMFNAMMNNQSEIKHSVLAKILDLYPDVNGDWLLSGLGDWSKKNIDQSKNNFSNSATYNAPLVAGNSQERELLQKIIMDKDSHIADLRRTIALLEKNLAKL
jgi:hypothetical protein